MEHWRDAILARLESYTGYKVDVGDTHVIVTCQNNESFDVSISANGGEFQVGFAGWHEHFASQEDALRCFAFGLSEECRLKVVKRGNMECSWTVQARQGDTWVDDTTTGLMLAPFWRAKTIEYRHNLISKVNP